MHEVAHTTNGEPLIVMEFCLGLMVLFRVKRLGFRV